METSSLEDIIAAVKQSAGHDMVDFDRPLLAKVSTYQSPFHMIGCQVVPVDRLYVIDGSNQWHEVEDRAEDTRIIAKLLKYFHLI